MSSAEQSPIELTWNNITVTTKAGVKILDNVSGQIKAGQAVGLLGPSGCGKTTLIGVLSGNSDAGLMVEGDVFFNGERMTQKHSHELIANVSQELVNYTHLTTLEILTYCSKYRYSGKEADVCVREILREFGLMDEANTVYEKLSGGQKLRLSIGRCILLDTPIMILDEPTSGLDSHSAKIVVDKLEYLAKQGKTLLISIHQPSLEILSIFDGIILMTVGNIVFLGTLKTAMNHFQQFGYDPTNTIVNPADAFMRMVTIDSRTDELQEKSEKTTSEIVGVWKSMNPEYSITQDAPIHYECKSNNLAWEITKIFLKFDIRQTRNFLLYAILMWVVIPSASAFYSPRFSEVTKKTYSEAFSEIGLQSGNLGDQISEFYQSGDLFYSEVLLNIFVKLIMIAYVTASLGTKTLSGNFKCLKRDYQNGMISKTNIATSFILYGLPYFVIQYAIVALHTYFWYMVNPMILVKLFVLHIGVSLTLLCFETSLFTLIPLNEYSSNIIINFYRYLPFYFQSLVMLVCACFSIENIPRDVFTLFFTEFLQGYIMKDNKFFVSCIWKILLGCAVAMTGMMAGIHLALKRGSVVLTA